nr:MAG TPA: hypothetical protein [Crassvirales sp.]
MLAVLPSAKIFIIVLSLFMFEYFYIIAST